MGTTSVYFRKKSELDYIKTKNDLVTIFKNLGYHYYINDCEYDKFNDSMYYEISVDNADSFDDLLAGKRGCEFLLLSVNEKCLYEDDHDFDWIGKGIDCAVSFEDIGKGKNIFLEITYHYLQKYPNDILWIDTELTYTKDEIEKIYQHKDADILGASTKPDYLL